MSVTLTPGGMQHPASIDFSLEGSQLEWFPTFPGVQNSDSDGADCFSLHHIPWLTYPGQTGDYGTGSLIGLASCEPVQEQPFQDLGQCSRKHALSHCWISR